MQRRLSNTFPIVRKCVPPCLERVKMETMSLTATNRNAETTTPRGRGRPRAFDRETALRAAMMVFWTHGFDAASYTELTAATGMSKPTLYANFGDKISLFRQSVLAYSEDAIHMYRKALALPTAREVVEACFRMARGVVDCPTDQPLVCFLVQGALTGSADTKSLRDELTRLRNQATAALQERLERAQREGDLPDSANPAVLAESVVALATGLSVQASGGSPPELLQQVVKLFLQAWPVRSS